MLGAVEPVERGGLVTNGSLASIPRADRHCREAFRSTVRLIKANAGHRQLFINEARKVAQPKFINR